MEFLLCCSFLYYKVKAGIPQILLQRMLSCTVSIFSQIPSGVLVP
uniref:Uncharacterized protein n=1 Tax=Daphnia magna TaxID=35525 RepID=A0A0P5TH65_9CRUS